MHNFLNPNKLPSIRFLLAAFVAVSACNGGEIGTNADGGPTQRRDTALAVDNVISLNFDVAPPEDTGICTPLISCEAPTGTYCGTIGNGCGDVLECGPCPTGQSCVGNVCQIPIDCDAAPLMTCKVLGGTYCGDIGNGCGGQLSCGDCPTGWTCTKNLCTSSPPFCSPITCGTGPGKYCGTIGDTCGNSLDCQGCPTGQKCHNNVCIPETNCQPITCTPTGGTYCGGTLGDGCGNAITCGDCTTPGWTCENNLCKGGPTCEKLTCGTGSGKYCGTVGDKCGGSLDCGDCIATETCKNNQCVPSGTCNPLVCNPTGGQYCGGDMGNGCGGLLTCNAPCPAGWVCKDNLCVGGPTCQKITACTNGTPFNYCGSIGDGCGGTLTCPTTCAAGQICDTKTGLCKGDATCKPIALCINGTIFDYCGTIGDGCGGSLSCPSTCATGQICDTKTGICKGDATCKPVVSCTNGTAYPYCGTIGDGCGGTLTCGNSCGANQVCNTATGMCHADATCKPLVSCANGTNFNYCGNIGDGCGGRLGCSATCAAGQVCGADGLCKGNASCVKKTCTNGTAYNYCGKVGDGCGGVLECSTACGPGKVCDTTTGLCKGDSTCVPKTCANGTLFNYCGRIGNGCGGTVECSTQCGPGKICDEVNHICKGNSSCTPITCTAANGGQYCGGLIGDGCGGSVLCNATCPTGMECQNNACICVSASCGACTNLCLKQVACTTGKTSIKGTVYDPAGKNPIYNVIVYVPNTPLDPITTGVNRCDSCDADVSGHPIAITLTDAKGEFTLENVPFGTDFPLVMQLGKWRRQITIRATEVPTQCAINPISDPTSATRRLRLPRNISDGDNLGQYTSMPKIAITTGEVDALECLLTRIGIDKAEFTNPDGTGHINLFSPYSANDPNRYIPPKEHDVNGAVRYSANYNAGASFPVAGSTDLLDSLQTELGYDIIMMNCAGDFPIGGNYVTEARRGILKNYANAGGKLFLEHYQWGWLKSGGGFDAPFGAVANWEADNPISNTDMLTTIDQSFPKGVAFASWLDNLSAGPGPGELLMENSSDDNNLPPIKYTASSVNSPSQSWVINGTSTEPRHVHYFDFLAPFAAANTCGRVVFTGIHVAASSGTQDSLRHLNTGFDGTFPGNCVDRDLNNQEKALEFLFFDLSGCVQPVNVKPIPPPITPANPPPAPPAPSPPAPPAAPPASVPPPAPAPPAPPAPVTSPPTAPPPPVSPAPPPPPPPSVPAPPPAPPPAGVTPPPPVPPPPPPILIP